MLHPTEAKLTASRERGCREAGFRPGRSGGPLRYVKVDRQRAEPPHGGLTRHEKAVDRVSSEPRPTGSVEFRDYLTVFKRQLVLIVAVTLLGAAAAAAYSFRRTPIYESTASVLVRAITTNADQLVKHVTADVPANSQIVRIHYRDTVALSAQRGAEAFAKAYLAFREADARTQATTSQKSLQRDIDRLVKQVDRAQATVEDASSTPEQIRGAQGRITALNIRIQPLQAQLTAFASLDFNPGTVISAAALPKQPASPKHRLDVGIGL